MTARVSRAEFARLAKVNRSTVTRWIKNGRVTVGPDGKLDPALALQERVDSESPLPHHQARKAQIDEEKSERATSGATSATRDTESGNTPTSSEIGLGLKSETLRLQRAKADKAALEVDQLAGSLAEREDFDYVYDDVGNVIRSMIEGLADKLAGPISAHGGDVNKIHKALSDASHDLLTDLVTYMRRRAEELRS